MAKKKRHSRTEIAAKLDEADALAANGTPQGEIARVLGISVMTYHRWRNARSHSPQSKAASASEANQKVPVADQSEPQRRARIAELERENTQLRKLVTDLLLEKMRLEDDAERLPSRDTIK